ncbi:MAG: fused DSP-PTPase phosphatase/NAD kinase-like protein [Armatimonadota bacterium]
MSNIPYHGFVRVLMLVLLVAGFALAGVAETPKVDPKALPNFQEVVEEQIYRGGAPTYWGMKKLKALGITTIIDLRIEKKNREEKKVAEELGFTWVHIPLGREAPTVKQVKTFLELLDKAEEEPVYVHCQHGADRTGAMIGIYRMRVQGWDFEKTWKEMRKYGFKTFLTELKDAVRYEKYRK